MGRRSHILEVPQSEAAGKEKGDGKGKMSGIEDAIRAAQRDSETAMIYGFTDAQLIVANNFKLMLQRPQSLEMVAFCHNLLSRFCNSSHGEREHIMRHTELNPVRERWSLQSATLDGTEFISNLCQAELSK